MANQCTPQSAPMLESVSVLRTTWVRVAPAVGLVVAPEGRGIVRDCPGWMK